MLQVDRFGWRKACMLYGSFEVSPCTEVRQIHLQVFQRPEIWKIRFNCTEEISCASQESQLLLRWMNTVLPNFTTVFCADHWSGEALHFPLTTTFTFQVQPGSLMARLLELPDSLQVAFLTHTNYTGMYESVNSEAPQQREGRLI